jgi:pimeloyl-ACP methyl ester carboxylesterase
MLQILKMAPDRFRAAVFLSTKSGADSPEGREKRFKNIELIEKEGLGVFADRQPSALLGKTTQAERPAVVAQVKEMARAGNPAGVCAALRGMAVRGDTSDLLDSLSIPCLFISGEEDGIIPTADIETMSKRVKVGEFHVVPKAGHLINLEQPARFHDLFLHFLKRRVL